MSRPNPHEVQNIRRLRSHLGECTVLLKKDGSFPLEKAGTIAAYGSGVRRTIKGGTGSGEVNSRYFINVERGLIKAGFTVVSTDWLDAYDRIREDNKKAFYRGIKEKAKKTGTSVIAAGMGAVMLEPEYELPLNYDADAAIYVLARSSGEGNDRLDQKGDYRLTDAEVRDILLLNEAYDKFMLVLNTGGPVDLSEVAQVRNILVLSQLGVETGRALAGLLLGKLVPSGRLTTTWAPYKDYGITSFGEIDDTFYSEGIYVGYRYFDKVGKTPAYPFGFGLSYTEFTHAFTDISAEGPVIRLRASVQNVGRFKGREVLQAYLSSPAGKIAKEAKSLAGFAKTKTLSPGESADVEITFDLRDRSSFDQEQAAYVLEAGQYLVRLGTSSADTSLVAILELEDEFIVRKVKHCLADSLAGGSIPPAEQVCAGSAPESSDSGDPACADAIPLLLLDLHDCETEIIDYKLPAFADSALDGLSAEELAYLNMGGFNPKGGILSVIGDASTRVAGAAGESTSALLDKGIGCAVVADGPAGLRIAKHYYKDKKGLHAVGSSMPETVQELLPKPLMMFLALTSRPPIGSKVYEQYTTALPIGTAIAQSWNTKFARICGDIVGNEMEIFHVDLWLAPALNIHRSVLCGRNFEYFSEDPLLSGLFAAALTRGVQSHKGKGVTIKHYAANNQETNRYGSSSNVSERALREIYLRGFEICIRKAAPLAVMSSYNLINGVHTSESAELCKDILRSEFGFDGVLMTDWIVGGDFTGSASKYPAPGAPRVAAAGHTLFMPGSKKDYDELLQGLKDGIVTTEQLKWNAHWLLQMLSKIGQ